MKGFVIAAVILILCNAAVWGGIVLADSDGQIKTPAQTFADTFTLEVEPGWNLISNGLDGPSELAAAHLTDGTTYHDAVTQGLLEYPTGWNGGYYEETFCLQQGRGYWVRSYSHQVITFTKLCPPAPPD